MTAKENRCEKSGEFPSPPTASGGSLDTTPPCAHCILHHFIQSITFKFADTKEKRAEYSLALFPEVGPSDSGGQNASGTDPKNGDGPDVLTPDAKLRQNGEKAPPADAQRNFFLHSEMSIEPRGEGSGSLSA